MVAENEDHLQTFLHLFNCTIKIFNMISAPKTKCIFEIRLKCKLVIHNTIIHQEIRFKYMDRNLRICRRGIWGKKSNRLKNSIMVKPTTWRNKNWSQSQIKDIHDYNKTHNNLLCLNNKNKRWKQPRFCVK